jgi:hypothetical protein
MYATVRLKDVSTRLEYKNYKLKWSELNYKLMQEWNYNVALIENNITIETKLIYTLYSRQQPTEGVSKQGYGQNQTAYTRHQQVWQWCAEVSKEMVHVYAGLTTRAVTAFLCNNIQKWTMHISYNFKWTNARMNLLMHVWINILTAYVWGFKQLRKFRMILKIILTPLRKIRSYLQIKIFKIPIIKDWLMRI